jgi:hypothetical protein
MRLHENKKLFTQAIRATAQQRGLLEIYIEKDYWVTLALKQIFSAPIGAEAVFKGGTALSKCYHIIERFSEDIDLVVLRREGESGNRLKNKLKAISEVVHNVLPEVQEEGITNKVGMIRKTAHAYPHAFKGAFGQVRNKVIVEASWLGHYEPYSTKQISSYIYEMMLSMQQEALAGEWELLPFEVQVLDMRRTLCEKIMSLARFSHSERPIENLRAKIRHTYDLYKLLKVKENQAFFLSPAFDGMLNKVGSDDVEGYRNDNAWLTHHPARAIIFSQAAVLWPQLSATYLGVFKDLVYGSLPDEAAIVQTLEMVSDRLEKIAWRVDPNKTTD